MSGCFEGWYFKQQSHNGDQMIAFIPAVHTDGSGHKSGSVQVVTPEKSWTVILDRPPVSHLKPALSVKAGGNMFSAQELRVDIRQPDLTVSGSLRFGPLIPPGGDIMGPYRFVPLMECRHSVFSLRHTVAGSLTLNGRNLDFTDGTGYIEGDRGRSFPKRYVWTQCAWEEDGEAGKSPCSLMLSVADVRPFGLPFTGIIGFVYFGGIEHRIATYRGAKILSAGNGAVSVRQGDDMLTVQLLDGGVQKQDGVCREAQVLRAPVSGEMKRLIRESLACRARYTFSVKERVLFDHITERASFEYEYP
jgi:hypothetical protein